MQGKKYHIISTSLLALVWNLGTMGLAEAQKSKSSSKESKAQKDSKSDSKQSQKESAESSKQAQKAHSKFAKPGEVTSLSRQDSVAETLDTPDSSDLLSSSKTNASVRPKTSVEVAKQSLNDLKKKAPLLALGVFRSENLSGGQVKAPGIADFAAYFRATDDKVSQPAGGPTASQTQSDASSGNLLGGADQDYFSRQAKAEVLRAETSESIKNILASTSKAESKVDLHLRLAELQVERHAYLLELEIKEFNETHEKWRNSGKGIEPIFKTDRSTAQLLVGIQSLRQVVNQFPSNPRAPEALFSLGFLLTQMNSDSASLYFEKLVKSYPKSNLVPDAHLALGEWHFSKMAWTKAQESYQKVLNFKGTRAYAYAVYKLGWTYFNMPENGKQQNTLKSLAAFKLIVKLAEDPKVEKQVLSLKKEALKDMVLVFAEIGDIAAAQSYFESLGEKSLYYTLLERLAWQNTEAGKYPEAVAIYGRLIAEAPQSEKLPKYFSNLAEVYEKMNRREKLVETLATASKTLAKQGEWNQANSKNPAALERRDALLGKETLVWAQKFHSDSQKTKSQKTLDEALACYDIYLQTSPETPESYTAHFFKAEILIQKGRFLEGADHYMKAASLDEKHKIGGKHTETALHNALLALDNVLAKSPPVKLPEAAKVPNPISLPKIHASIVSALDAFARMFPKEPEALGYSHRAASIQYAFGHYEDANKRWTALAGTAPKSKEAYDGVRLLLKVPVTKEDWPTAISEARKFLKTPGIEGTKLATDLTIVLKSSIFQNALALEKAEKRSEAAAQFLAYHKEFQTDADAPKALFNGANNLFRVGKMDEALSTLQTLIAQYPKSELNPHVLYLVGNSYDALGQFGESASSFEQLAELYPKIEASKEALLRATVQRNAIRDFEKGLANAQKYISRHPLSDDVQFAHIQLAAAYSRTDRAPEALKALSDGADALQRNKNPKAVLLYAMAAEAAFKAGQKPSALKLLQTGENQLKAIGEKKKSADDLEAARLLGSTQLALADEQLSSVLKKQISDGLRLTEEFTKIREEVQGLANRYIAVVKLGNAESGIAAMYRMAEMQEHLANILLKAPAPTGASPADLEQFRSTLEKIGLPLQEEAVGLYQKAWEKANETEAMTPFTKKILEKMAIFRPGEYHKVVEDMPVAGYYSSDIVSNSATKKVFSN